jgi:flagella basal body P-ring formation protein FlgA
MNRRKCEVGSSLFPGGGAFSLALPAYCLRFMYSPSQMRSLVWRAEIVFSPSTSSCPPRRSPPGGVISEDMLMTRRIRVRRPITGLYATRLDEAAGMVAKRTLRANRAIPVSMLRQPYLFKEGQRVELLFAHGALSIVASGVALEPGAAGRTVSVRNIDSGRVVRGEVANDGRVLVGGP